MTQTIINAEDYSVQERSVSIKVLTIGTKQITQALYQQLPDGEIIEYDEYEDPILDKNVEIWGWVNVCTPVCKQMKDSHVHVIYEIKGELKRSRISRSWMSKDTRWSDLQSNLRTTPDNKERRHIQALMAKNAEQWHTIERIINGQLFIAVSGVWK